MIKSLLVILWTSPVMSDMCQDLCLQELGRSGCAKGSWCKSGYDCQSLFWTTSDRSNICVYTGSSGICKNRYPVLCHEAIARLSGTTGIPIRTSTTMTRTTPIPTTSSATTTTPIPTTATTTTTTQIPTTSTIPTTTTHPTTTTTIAPIRTSTTTNTTAQIPTTSTVTTTTPIPTTRTMTTTTPIPTTSTATRTSPTPTTTTTTTTTPIPTKRTITTTTRISTASTMTTTTPIPTTATITTTTPIRVSTTTITTAQIPATITATTTTPISTTSTTTTTPATMSTTRRNIEADIGDSSDHVNDHLQLSLHRSPFEQRDPRPRVKVNFLAHGQDIGFSLLFDTGSVRTHIVRAEGPESGAPDAPPSYLPEDGIDSSLEPVHRPARWMEGYLDVGSVSQTGGAGKLMYGPDDDLRAIHVTRRINEMAQLFSGATSFVHEVEIDLTNKMDNRATGIGLLGAGPTSHFAREAGLFAFMGPLVDNKHAPAGGTLHIVGRDGGEHLNSLCRAGSNIEFFPLAGRADRIHWVVRGSIQSGAIRNELTYLIDTGATGIFVTPDILMAIKAALVEGGAILVAAVPGYMEQYKYCYRYRSLPTINFSLGSGPSAVTVSVSPDDYIIRRPTRPNGTCFLGLSDATARTSQILGVEILSKLLTVFDQTRNRIGFCQIRS